MGLIELPSSRSSRPTNDQLEVSVFGPGFGECVVLHLGNSNWAVVDSCASKTGKDSQPVALEYLESMGVQVEHDVQLVLVSHWHDDHIRGISQLVRSCVNARFAISSALKTKEFATLLAQHDDIRLVSGYSGISEMNKSLDERDGSPDIWVVEGLPLVHGTEKSASIIALSPSPHQITKSLISIDIPKPGEPIKGIKNISPNHLSIVLKVELGEIGFLLGADLENTSDKKLGWHAVLEAHNGVQSCVFKVPHHGSENAHNDQVWDKLLNSADAIVTPFRKLKTPLPTDTDIERISRKSNRAFCTAKPKLKKPSKRSRPVDRTINETVRSRRQFASTPGQVRIRISPNGEKDIQLFDGAFQVK